MIKKKAKSPRRSGQSRKSARLEARVRPDTYALVRRAAVLQGRSVTDFVVAAAKQVAEEAILRSQMIKLSRDDQKRFVAALLNPKPPTPAMRRAAAAHRRLIKQS